jgi:hypothetical protein
MREGIFNYIEKLGTKEQIVNIYGSPPAPVDHLKLQLHLEEKL